MLRHKKAVHTLSETEEEMEEGTDMLEHETESTSDSEEEDVTSSESEDDGERIDPWDRIIDRVFSKCQKEYEDNVRDYARSNGVDENVAKQRVYRNMRSVYRREMADVFLQLIELVQALLRDKTYATIKKTASSLRDFDGYDVEESWKYAVKKRKFLFDKILREYEEPEMTQSSAIKRSEQGGGGIGIIGKRSGKIRSYLDAGGDSRLERVNRWADKELKKEAPKVTVIGDRRNY